MSSDKTSHPGVSSAPFVPAASLRDNVVAEGQCHTDVDGSSLEVYHASTKRAADNGGIPLEERRIARRILHEDRFSRGSSRSGSTDTDTRSVSPWPGQNPRVYSDTESPPPLSPHENQSTSQSLSEQGHISPQNHKHQQQIPRGRDSPLLAPQALHHSRVTPRSVQDNMTRKPFAHRPKHFFSEGLHGGKDRSIDTVLNGQSLSSETGELKLHVSTEEGDARSSDQTHNEESESYTTDVEDIAGYALNHVFGLSLASLDHPYPALEEVERCVLGLKRVVEDWGPGWNIHDRPEDTETPQQPSENRTSGQNQGKKRARDSNNGSVNKDEATGGNTPSNDGEDEDDETPAPSESRSLKRQKRDSHQFPCPYRQRNRVKFNARDCAQARMHCVDPLTGLSKVKHHIQAHHMYPKPAKGRFKCILCGTGCPDEATWRNHVAAGGCAVNPPNEEAGLTRSEIDDMMSRKDASCTSWTALWHLLFPHDPQHSIPRPNYIPVVEVEELISQMQWETLSHRLVSTVWETMSTTLTTVDSQSDIECFGLAALRVENILRDDIRNAATAIRGHKPALDRLQRQLIPASRSTVNNSISRPDPPTATDSRAPRPRLLSYPPLAPRMLKPQQRARPSSIGDCPTPITPGGWNFASQPLPPDVTTESTDLNTPPMSGVLTPLSPPLTAHVAATLSRYLGAATSQQWPDGSQYGTNLQSSRDSQTMASQILPRQQLVPSGTDEANVQDFTQGTMDQMVMSQNLSMDSREHFGVETGSMEIQGQYSLPNEQAPRHGISGFDTGSSSAVVSMGESFALVPESGVNNENPQLQGFTGYSGSNIPEGSIQWGISDQ